MRCLALCCATGMLLGAAPAYAQNVDTQLWTTQSASIPVNDIFGVSLDSTQRFGDAAGGQYEFVGGFFLTFQVSKAIQLGAGYSHTTGYRIGPNTGEERPRQQVVLKLGHFSGRWRLEERMRNDGRDLGLRTRLQLRWAQPFTRTGKTQWVVYHESFAGLNGTDWGQVAGYNRMRNFIGLRRPLIGPVEIEAGYLNQYDFKPRTDAMAHVALLSLSFGFQALSHGD